MAVSQAKMDANRLNAQHSTGPRTPEGKARASLNATRSGLTGQVVVLPGEDLAIYQAFCREYFEEWRPKGPTEKNLVQSLADNQWRIHRAHAHELGVYANGLARFGNRIEADRAEVHTALTGAVVEVEQSAQLDRLSRHGSRIQRDFENTLKQLQQLQAARMQREESQLEDAAMIQKLCEMKAEPHEPAEFGFVLKSGQVKSYIQRSDSLVQAKIAQKASYDVTKFRQAGGSDGPILITPP